jgi:hypothetical protein
MTGLRKIGGALGTALLVLSLAACGVEGSGNIVGEERDVGGFDSIDVSQGIAVDVLVEEGASYAVTVNYDDNILDKLITSVSGGSLVVKFNGSVRLSGSSTGRVVEVVMPKLEAVEASGGASVTARGPADLLSIDASGGASINTSDLLAVDVTVDVSGGASLRVFASGSVTGDASGGASVDVVGSPGVLNVDSSGGASVSSR